MTIPETIGTLVGSVIVAHLIIAGLSALTKGRPKRPVYTLDQQWTGDALLWTATDEVVAGGGHGSGHAGHGGHAAIASAELIGGRASGRY